MPDSHTGTCLVSRCFVLRTHTIFLKISRLGGAHPYGCERTGVGSDSSISYVVQLAVPKIGENRRKIRDKKSQLPPPVQASSHVSTLETSSHKFCKNCSFPISAFCSEKVPLQLGANMKLNFLEATSINILVRSKKSNPQNGRKGPPSQYFELMVPRERK